MAATGSTVSRMRTRLAAASRMEANSPSAQLSTASIPPGAPWQDAGISIGIPATDALICIQIRLLTEPPTARSVRSCAPLALASVMLSMSAKAAPSSAALMISACVVAQVIPASTPFAFVSQIGARSPARYGRKISGLGSGHCARICASSFL